LDLFNLIVRNAAFSSFDVFMGFTFSSKRMWNCVPNCNLDSGPDEREVQPGNCPGLLSMKVVEISLK
jgi:hypothetical protein